jgi:hypothetical protein
MLRNYRSQTPWPRLAKCDNEEYVLKLLTTMLAGMGMMFVSERDYEITGMLLAIKQPNIWDPSIIQMNELAYWVEPEHRGSTAGYKLIKAYQNYCEDLVSQGKLESYTISKMVNSPDLDYGRFGFKKQEEMWRK